MMDSIGKHLASLNLFREADGTVEITIAGGTGAVEEWRNDALNFGFSRPHEYIEALIIEAAERMKARRP